MNNPLELHWHVRGNQVICAGKNQTSVTIPPTGPSTPSDHPTIAIICTPGTAELAYHIAALHNLWLRSNETNAR